MTMRKVHIVLSFGLVLLLEKYRIDPRYKYLLWGLIAANEIRGLITVYGVVQYGGLFSFT